MGERSVSESGRQGARRCSRRRHSHHRRIAPSRQTPPLQAAIWMPAGNWGSGVRGGEAPRASRRQRFIRAHRPPRRHGLFVSVKASCPDPGPCSGPRSRGLAPVTAPAIALARCGTIPTSFACPLQKKNAGVPQVADGRRYIGLRIAHIAAVAGVEIRRFFGQRKRRDFDAGVADFTYGEAGLGSIISAGPPTGSTSLLAVLFSYQSMPTRFFSR